MFLRLFEKGEVGYENMFAGEMQTYESNMPYILRFMIDTNVSTRAFCFLYAY